MTLIQLLACVGMLAGLFMVLHISLKEMSDSIFSRLTSAPCSIRADVNEITRRRKAGFFRREISEAQAVLAASGREGKFPMVCMASLVLFAAGACIAILAGNAFLVPVLAVGLMLVPFWYIKLTAGSFKKDVAAELETALSVICLAKRHSRRKCIPGLARWQMNRLIHLNFWKNFIKQMQKIRLRRIGFPFCET